MNLKLLPALLCAAILASVGRADLIQPLGDEFNSAASIARWSNLQEVERWGANQLEAWDINTDTPLDQWRFEKFGANAGSPNALPLADYDSDGVLNLVEFALDSTPTTPTTQVLPQSGTSGNRLTLTFTRNLGTTALNYFVEAADDVRAATWPVLASKIGSGAWGSAGGATVSENASGVVTVTDAQTMAGSNGRFMRLRVVAP